MNRKEFKEATKLYKQYRAADNRAVHAWQWAKSTLRESRRAYISAMPDSNDSTVVPVPGIGTLQFYVEDDNDHNALGNACGVKFEWMELPYGSKAHKYVGSKVGRDTYALSERDRGKQHVAVFDKDSNVAARRRYHTSQGCSRQDAELLACEGVRRECDWWVQHEKNDITYVGLIVKLWRDCKLIAEESCWGFEAGYGLDYSYHLGEMNGWAQGMVEKEWGNLYPEVPVPSTFVQGFDRKVDAAYQAWHAALITSDNDREFADPVFVAAMRGKHGVHSRRIVQVRTRAR